MNDEPSMLLQTMEPSPLIFEQASCEQVSLEQACLAFIPRGFFYLSVSYRVATVAISDILWVIGPQTLRGNAGTEHADDAQRSRGRPGNARHANKLSEALFIYVLGVIARAVSVSVHVLL